MNLEERLGTLVTQVELLTKQVTYFANQMTTLREENALLRQQLRLQNIGSDLFIGKSIVSCAERIPSEEFLKRTEKWLGYLPDLSREAKIGPQVLQGKKLVMLDDVGALSEGNVQTFYTNFFNSLLQERFPDRKEKDQLGVVMDVQSTFSGSQPINLFPDLIVGSQTFESADYYNKQFSKCPPLIIEFKQNRLSKTKQHGFESPSHQVASYLARCFKNHAHLPLPDFLVGIVLDLDGAEVYFVRCSAFKNTNISKDSVKRFSLSWNFHTLIQSLKKETQLVKGPQSSQTNPCFYFYDLLDFILFLVEKNKTDLE